MTANTPLHCLANRLLLHLHGICGVPSVCMRMDCSYIIMYAEQCELDMNLCIFLIQSTIFLVFILYRASYTIRHNPRHNHAEVSSSC